MAVPRATGTPAANDALRAHSPAICRHARGGPRATGSWDQRRRGLRLVCGILGAVRGAVGGVGRGPFGGALGVIRHRGPHAFNALEPRPVLLAHARLSLIDLSEAA